MEHIALTMFLRVFSKISEIEEIEKIEKSEENIKKKKVYTSEGINASDLITRVFFNSCKKEFSMYLLP
jgi:hypothetical protein